MSFYRRLLPFAALLALAVVGLGAWVRLSDAGLGCPDWPGCYGQWLGVPGHAADAGKAWKEMVHRYFAGTLGLVILGLCLSAWRERAGTSPILPTALVGIVVLQALLGMWTVTLLLKPLVVSAHLLGGMTTLALLWWLNLRAAGLPPPPQERMTGVRTTAALTLLAVIGQIALGGWVSSNYAALACPDFPTCQGAWLPAMDFGPAFTLHRQLGQTADGALLPMAALTAIHWSHRLGALAVAVIVGGLGFGLVRRPGWRNHGALLLVLLALQLCLGVANILLALPLPLAVAHNVGAALLLSAVVSVNFRLWAGARAVPANSGMPAGPAHEGEALSRT